MRKTNRLDTPVRSVAAYLARRWIKDGSGRGIREKTPQAPPRESRRSSRRIALRIARRVLREKEIRPVRARLAHGTVEEMIPVESSHPAVKRETCPRTTDNRSIMRTKAHRNRGRDIEYPVRSLILGDYAQVRHLHWLEDSLPPADELSRHPFPSVLKGRLTVWQRCPLGSGRGILSREGRLEEEIKAEKHLESCLQSRKASYTGRRKFLLGVLARHRRTFPRRFVEIASQSRRAALAMCRSLNQARVEQEESEMLLKARDLDWEGNPADQALIAQISGTSAEVVSLNEALLRGRVESDNFRYRGLHTTSAMLLHATAYQPKSGLLPFKTSSARLPSTSAVDSQESPRALLAPTRAPRPPISPFAARARQSERSVSPDSKAPKLRMVNGLPWYWD